MGLVDRNLKTAEAAVEKAKAAVARGKDAAEELKVARREGARLQKEYSALVQAAREAIRVVAMAEGNVNNANDAISAQIRNKPELCTDEEMEAWERSLAKLRSLLKRCAATKVAAAGEATSARLKVIHKNEELQRVIFHVKTLARLAAGEDPNDPSWSNGGSPQVVNVADLEAALLPVGRR
jgi:DnaJ-domain-containing protein 1